MFDRSSNKIEREFKNLRNELLDLTLRNQLLNFKLRAKTIAIENQSSINIFQNLVLQNKKMYFEANKKENKDKSRSSVWNHLPNFSNIVDGDKTLKTNLTPTELQKRLFYINNQAKTMLQEQGYNILYLAVGFLEWTDNKKPNQKNLAPLILIPVTIERKKVGKSFELSWTGEDIQTNISLKAKLKEDGITLPDFKFKRYGEVLDHYIRYVRDITSHMKGWSVNSNIALGFFSFTKFVMYNDLNPESWDDNVDLTQKELIQAIFNPEVNNQEAFDEQDIDSQLDYGSMYQVLDADSSQIAVIEDVKAGRNLVVEGPPGTGKSQTIVNLIAELLAEGKTVLFVSEKMAALEVVKERLQSVGLGKFVLELHSHKTRRKKFLKELEKAANVRAEEPLDIEPTIRKLETLKRELDSYPETIHQKYYGINASPFELYGMKEDAESYFVKKDKLMPLVKFNQPELITIKDLDDMVFALENVAELFQTISSENPWSKCAPDSLLPSDLREIEMLIVETLQAVDEFILERQWINENFGIKSAESLSDFSKSINAFQMIQSKNSNFIDSSMLNSDLWKLNNNDPYVLIDNLEKYQKFAGILDKFNDNIFQVDIDLLIADVEKVANKKFRLFKNKQNQGVVERFYRTPVPDTNQILRDLNTVKLAVGARNYLQSQDSLARQYFGNNWSLSANPNDLKAIVQWMKEFQQLVNEGILTDKTLNLLSNDLFNVNIEDSVSRYTNLGREFEDKLAKLNRKLNPQSRLIFNKDIENVTLEQWKNQLNIWRGQLSSLHLWSQYLNTKQSLKGTYSEPFVEVIERRSIDKEDVKPLVYGNFADALLNILFFNNHELASFIGELHENKIKEFKDLDKKILEINRKRIFQKLNSNIPDIFGGAQGSEAQILAGEFTRKSGHLPVRKLLQKAGGLIKQIKPVFMMSPLSIAQYLDPTNEKLQFDVVIFDEASQVKPQDALGAFMRAKTAVVMGDTQQLPPTSFFEQMADGESYEEEATSLDMESILHLCKLSFPVKMLKWHYRSRHESLISVSNSQFYDDELLVYPSPSHNDPELGLKLHYNPNTYYDRGSSAANVGEAKDVVKAIFEHFDKYGDTKSLGVGTFSVAQKNAILEELELQRKQRPELEPLFAENKEERFFVKNLETIQGDERDVILISVGYGYDKEGKMSLNFGPLNQEGGERRLNVLITRAREKCVVFSNFKATDMHLTENPPYGVKSLKEFLFYADNVSNGNKTTTQLKEQKFEDAIAKFLEENGYTVERQIGCAGFRVDLAIVDEQNPGRYILGITTDGEMYSSSKVARDRNRLREQVLEGLGWNIYHLWSTDWYRNRSSGRDKLLKAIDDAKITQQKLSKLKQEEAEKRKLEVEKLKTEYENNLIENSDSEEDQIFVDEGPIEGEIVVEQPIVENEEEIIIENADGTISVEKVKHDNNSPNVDEMVISGDLESEEDEYNDAEYVFFDEDEDLESVVNVEDIKEEFINEVTADLESEEEYVFVNETEEVPKDNNLEEEFVDEIIVDNVYEPVEEFVDEINGDVGSSDEIIVDNVYEPVEEFVVENDNVSQSSNKSNKKNKGSKKHKKQNDEINVEFKGELSEDFEDINKNNLKSPTKKPKQSNKNNKYNQFKDKKVSNDSVEYVVEKDDFNSSNNVQNSIGRNESYDLEVNQKNKSKNGRKGIINSIIDSFKGDTKLNVTGSKTYDDDLREVYTPEVEVNRNPVRPNIKKKNVIDVVVNDPNSKGNVFDKDENINEMANKVFDDVFDSILDNNDDNSQSSPKQDEISNDNFTENEPSNEFDESYVENDHIENKQYRYVEPEIPKSSNEVKTESPEIPIVDESEEEDYIADEYYQSSNDLNSPLRKNNLHKNKKPGNSFRSSLSDLKDNVTFLNKALNEIENPSQREYINTIDRTKNTKKAKAFLDNEKDLRDEYFVDEKPAEVEYQEEKLAEMTKYEIDYSKEHVNYEEELSGISEYLDELNDVDDYSEEEIISSPVKDIVEQPVEEPEEDVVEIIKNEIENDEGIIRINKGNRPRKIVRIMEYETTEGINISADTLYNSSSEEVSKIVNKIVEVEGPIHINELIKRIRESSDIKRVGAKLKKAVNDAVEVSEQSGNIIKANDFLFNSSNQSINIRRREKPNIELISDEEIEMNIKYILKENKTFDSSKIAKEASNNFGFKSVSKKTANKINNVLDSMIVEGKVILDGKNVKLN